MASVSNKPWSDVNKTVEAYGSAEKLCAASLIDENEPDSEKTVSKCSLPVYEPSGALNANALSSAVGYLNDTDASAESKAKARRKLLSLYKQADMDPPDSIKETAYQTPFDDAGAVELGGKLWKKQVLPNRSISYEGGTLSFDRSTAERIAESFKKGAFEHVPFLIGNGHDNDTTKTGGVVRGLEASDEGLWATIETNDEGEQALRRNFNSLPVSVRYLSDYTRESDGQKFGPTIQHVAATFVPRMTGMSGWKTVEASDDGERVIDLTGEEYGSGKTATESELSPEDQALIDEIEREVEDEADNGNPDDETEEEESEMADNMPSEGDTIQFKRGGSTHEGTFKRMEGEGDSRVAVVDVDGEEVKVPVSMLQKGSGSSGSEGDSGDAKDNSEGSDMSVDLAEAQSRIAELEAQAKRYAESDRRNTLELRRQRVERELEEYGRAGVPAVDLDAARPLLMDDESTGEITYTDLSEEGAQEKKSARGDLVRKMLDSRKGTIEFGEKGDAAAQLSEDEAKDKKIREYAKENELSYGEAARYVS